MVDKKTLKTKSKIKPNASGRKYQTKFKTKSSTKPKTNLENTKPMKDVLLSQLYQQLVALLTRTKKYLRILLEMLMKNIRLI